MQVFRYKDRKYYYNYDERNITVDDFSIKLQNIKLNNKT